jgi:hypothetical protein
MLICTVSGKKSRLQYKIVQKGFSDLSGNQEGLGHGAYHGLYIMELSDSISIKSNTNMIKFLVKTVIFQVKNNKNKA